MQMFGKTKEFFWPLGATILAMFVVPIAIEQYPEVFKDAPWILPISIVLVCLCWFIPLLVHHRVRRIHGWMLGNFGAKWGWVAVMVIWLIVAVVLLFSGYKLYQKHATHLQARLGKQVASPASAVSPQPKPELPSPKPEQPRTPNKGGRRKETPIPGAPPQSIPIEISAMFYEPKDPSIVVTNSSDDVAEGVTWAMIAIRKSDLGYFGFVTQSIGYIKPHSESGRYALQLDTLAKGSDAADKQIHDGDELTGSISIDCPHCQGRTYIVHLVWKQSGWFFEFEHKSEYVAPKDMSPEGRTRYMDLFTGATFLSKRIEIASKPQ